MGEAVRPVSPAASSGGDGGKRGSAVPDASGGGTAAWAVDPGPGPGGVAVSVSRGVGAAVARAGAGPPGPGADAAAGGADAGGGASGVGADAGDSPVGRTVVVWERHAAAGVSDASGQGPRC